ncbi:MAG: TonB-dependent receptor [Alphaproteobacteria bacterium]|nr:TonB-dependent receptor [Alphaproteobacteria bacterium]
MVMFFVLAQAAAPAATVVASPAQAPAPAGRGVVSYPASYFASAGTSNALDMVNRLPDFTLETGSGVRGYEEAAGNVLIDGQRPTSKSDPLDSILQRIPASDVARIDVIRGGAPGIDMMGKSVIANVIRKKDTTIRGLVAVANQHVNDGRNLGGLRIEASGALPGDRKWELGVHPGAGPDDGAGPGHNVITYADGAPPFIARVDTKGTDVQGVGTGSFDTPLLGGKLHLNGRLSRDKFREPETDYISSPAPDVQRFAFHQRNQASEAGGRYSYKLGPSTDLDVVGLHSTHRSTVDSSSTDANPSVTGADASNAFFNDRHSTETIARGVLKQRFGRKLSFEGGAEFADNLLHSRTTFVENGAPQVVPAANVQVEEKRSETFLKSAWRPVSTLNVDASLHYESSQISSRGDVVLTKSLQFAKPHLAVAWTPIRSTQLRFRVEREVSQLNFDDFVASSNLTTSVGVTAGNPNLNPEQDWVYEGAIEQQLWKGSSIVLTARHYQLTDVIDRGPVRVVTPDPATGQPVVSYYDQPANIGAGTKDEFAATVTLRFDRFGWKGAMIKGDITRRYSEVTDPTTGEKREISNLRPLEWEVNFSQDVPRYNLSLGFDICCAWRQTAYRYNFIETVKIKPYVKPWLEWKPRPDLSVRIEVPLATHPQVRLRDEIQIFSGPRAPGMVPDVQERTFTFPRSWYVRVLKNFG